jgi:hypothetical protein
MYLGDGCIARSSKHSSIFLLTLDPKYEGIVGEAATAIRRVAPDVSVRRYDRRGVVLLQASHVLWPYAFPQHGPGRKHLRRIELTEWQAELTTSQPRALLRGLIHSDGCRCVNRFSVKLPSGRVGQYEYVRYFFSNLSADIRHIFCSHCEELGIRWTQSNHRNISISHRASVALLDSFVGPKA